MQRNHNRPETPLLGNLTTQQLEEVLRDTLTDEATAAEFYTDLLNEAPDNLHTEFIEHARDDELIHLDYFKRLYRYLFGRDAEYGIEETKYANYEAGLLMALKDELEAAEHYRDVELSVKDPLIKETFYYAMIDELEHATQFSTLYNR
ncbi:MAG: ferritin family protein [Eubacteriales bacterium]